MLLCYSGKLHAIEIFRNGDFRLEHDFCIIKIGANQWLKSDRI